MTLTLRTIPNSNSNEFKANTPNSLKIQVTIKSVYGNDTVYPVCNTAQGFVDLLGRKTLTPRDIQYIKALGYTVEVVYPSTTL